MAIKPPKQNAALERDRRARARLLESSGGEPEYGLEALREQRAFMPPEQLTIEAPATPQMPTLLPTDIEVQEPLPEGFEKVDETMVPRSLIERVQNAPLGASVYPTAEEQKIIDFKQKQSPVLAEAFKKASVAPAPEVPTAPPRPPEAPAAAPTPPAATPPAPTPPTAQEDRLSQLARIISTTSPAIGTEDVRRRAIVDALSKAQLAMSAGLTRSPVPAGVFAPPPEMQQNRLEQLYRASQILGKPGTAAEQVDPLLIEDLQRQFPNAQLPSNMTLSQFREVANILNRERTEGGKKERFNKAREQAAKQHDDRMGVAKQKMDKQEWQYVTSEIGDKQKQVAGIQSAMPIMQEIVDNSLASYNLPGGEALRALKLGQFTPEQEQMWNVVFEQLVSPARKELFGATLTGNELAAFNVMVGLGPDASVGTKLNALRMLMKRMQTSLKGAFGGIQDTEAFQNYRNATGDLTHFNPVWAEFDESLAEAAANAPKAGEAAKMAGERISGAVKKAATGAMNVLGSVVGGKPAPIQAPAVAPAAQPTQKYTETKMVGGKKYGFVKEGESGYWEEIEE